MSVEALPREQTRAWDELAARIDRLNRSNPRAAGEMADRWLANELENGSDEGHARALRAHAHAQRFLGHYEQAVAEYEEAERRFEALGLRSEAARTGIGHVTALRYLGRYQEAIDLARRTRAHFLEHGELLEAAKQANNLGTVYRRTGRLAAAARVYREARTVFRRLAERSSLADVEQNLGNVLVDLGRYEQALKRLRAAERIRRELGLQTEVALTLMNIGVLSHQWGDYGQALQALGEAREMYESLGVERGARLVDLHTLSSCMALNLRQESIEAAARAIAGLRELEMPFELGQALLAAGRLAADSGEGGLAREQIEEARALFVRTGNPIWESRARLQEARRVATGGEQAELEAALQECRLAIGQLEAARVVDQAAFGRLVEGSILARLAEPGEALKCFQQVHELGTTLGADHLLYQARAALGELLESTEPEQAIAHYRLAIQSLEAVRARTRADALKLSFLADKADLYERLVALLIRAGSEEAVDEAFSFVERSKSRTLLEELFNGSRQGGGQGRSELDKLARRARDIQTRLNTVYAKAYGGDEPPSSDRLVQSNQAQLVARLEEEYARATRALQLAAREHDPMLASLTGEPAHGLSMPPGSALVEFYALGSELVAFVKTADALKLRCLTTVDEVADLAEQLSFQIGSGAFGSAYLCANIDKFRRAINFPLNGLYQAIIEPLEADLAGCDTLVIVPHGPLHSLPFHAFHDGERYLADRFTVSYAPSAGVYRMCLQAARPLGERAVVVGIDDPGLPSVRQEVEAVARSWPKATVLSGRRATSRALRRQAGRFCALHVATHAVFRSDNPMFSSIKLADAWLTAADLGEVVRGAQLVTLSACETGLAGLASGDEILGLTRGILGAGCSTVVASLWIVPDETTALLMEQFYGFLRDGAGPAEALRSAMLALRAAYDHPYFWAPFAVIGAGFNPPAAPDGEQAATARPSLSDPPAPAGSGQRGGRARTRGRERPEPAAVRGRPGSAPRP